MFISQATIPSDSENKPKRQLQAQRDYSSIANCRTKIQRFPAQTVKIIRGTLVGKQWHRVLNWIHCALYSSTVLLQKLCLFVSPPPVTWP